MIQYLNWLYLQAVSIQREIYESFAVRIGSYSETGDWSQLVIFLPLGIAFGVIHAMTPGHSKTVLAAYTLAAPGGMGRALSTAFILSAVHVLMSVAIVLLSLPLVSSTLGSAGRAPLLEDLSRFFIGLIGVWMIWAAYRPSLIYAPKQGNRAFAVFAGLIPCPLTFFVMTFAVAKGVVEAGLAFAMVMLIGVFVTLGSLALAVVTFRQGIARLASSQGNPVFLLGRLSQAAVGICFLALGIMTIVN